MRWFLAPILLLFAALFLIPLLEAIDEQRQAGVISTSLVITLCVAGALTLGAFHSWAESFQESKPWRSLGIW